MGMLMGLLNGVVVHKFRVPAIIVTIATFNLYFGLLYVITGGKLINLVHPLFQDLRQHAAPPPASRIGGTYGLSLMPLIWLASLVLGWFILRRTFLGRSVFAMGGNEVAAERIGIPTLRTRLFVFGFMGLPLRGGGGGPPLHRPVGGPEHHRGQELEVIAAVVMGGASVFGGKGTLLGTFLGVLLFAILNNGLTLLEFSSYWYNVAIGVVITVAITNSAYQQLRQQRTRVNVKIEA